MVQTHVLPPSSKSFSSAFCILMGFFSFSFYNPCSWNQGLMKPVSLHWKGKENVLISSPAEKSLRIWTMKAQETEQLKIKRMSNVCLKSMRFDFFRKSNFGTLGLSNTDSVMLEPATVHSPPTLAPSLSPHFDWAVLLRTSEWFLFLPLLGPWNNTVCPCVGGVGMMLSPGCSTFFFDWKFV